MIRLPVEQRLHIRDALRTARARMWIFVVVTGLLTASALLLLPPSTVAYGVGTVATAAVKAPRSVAFVSESLTNVERDRAAAAVPKQYTSNPATVATSSSRLTQALTDIGRVRADTSLSRDQRITVMTRLTGPVISPALATDIVDMTGGEWDTVAKELDNVLRTLYAQGIRPEQLDATRTTRPRRCPRHGRSGRSASAPSSSGSSSRRTCSPTWPRPRRRSRPRATPSRRCRCRSSQARSWSARARS